MFNNARHALWHVTREQEQSAVATLNIYLNTVNLSATNSNYEYTDTQASVGSK